MKKFRWGMRGRTLFVTITIVPSVLAGIGFTSYSAIKIIRRDAREIISLKTEKLQENISRWLNNNALVLKNMSQQPGIISLDPQRQQPILNTALVYYDNIYLAHTANLEGTNITRSDRQAPQNYADRLWFKGAIAGNDITAETYLDRTTQKPTLCTAAPVRQEGIIVATVATCSWLDALAEWVEQANLGQTGIALVVNSKGEMLAHSDPQYIFSEKLADLREYPPVANVLNGNEGTFIFTDDVGIDWIAHGRALSNSWVIITLQHRSEAFAAEQPFYIVAIAASILTMAMALVLIREFIVDMEQQALKQRREKELESKAIQTSIEEFLTTKNGNLSMAANLDLEELSSIADLLDAIVANTDMAIEEQKSTHRFDL